MDQGREGSECTGESQGITKGKARYEEGRGERGVEGEIVEGRVSRGVLKREGRGEEVPVSTRLSYDRDEREITSSSGLTSWEIRKHKRTKKEVR